MGPLQGLVVLRFVRACGVLTLLVPGLGAVGSRLIIASLTAPHRSKMAQRACPVCTLVGQVNGDGTGSG